MKHCIAITPLNCSFSEALNGFVTMEPSEYEAANSRAVYCREPDLSWFKFKSVTDSPYLEPAFFGLRGGDIITVDFDALVQSGEVADFGCTFTAIDCKAAVESPAYAQLLPDGSFYSHFTHYTIPFVVMPQISGFTGIRVRIGANANTPCEMIVKNIEITVETSNHRFALRDGIASYRKKRDYLNCVRFHAGTDISKAFHSLKKRFESGSISFPDAQTVSFDEAPGQFGGLMALMSAGLYASPQVAYFEYEGEVSVRARDFDHEGGKMGTRSASVKIASSWRRQIMYFAGQCYDARNTLLSVGSFNGKPLKLKNVFLSVPRFDDCAYREPNKLEELFSGIAEKG
jgi:hypothetical protein